MTDMEGMELISFQIISAVGAARSMYIEAIHLAKEGCFDEAKETIRQGQEMFLEGHHAHAQLLQREGAKESAAPGLLLVHAEDQLMSAEAFGILAEEFLSVYQTIQQHRQTNGC